MSIRRADSRKLDLEEKDGGLAADDDNSPEVGIARPADIWPN